MRGRLTIVALLLMPACGGTADPPSGSGGGEATGGTASSGSSGGSSAETGGSLSTGGTAEAVGGSGGTESCPAVHASRLLPWVGPFFMGPDPGPCAQARTGDPNGTGTYTYEDGLVQSSTIFGGEVYTRDAEGRMITYLGAGGDGVGAVYVYEESAFIETYGPATTRYELDPQGYPVRAIQEPGTAEERIWEYQYEDCRLVSRIAPLNSNSPDRLYSYDAEGHIISYAEGATVVTFDYSCWN